MEMAVGRLGKEAGLMKILNAPRYAAMLVALYFAFAWCATSLFAHGDPGGQIEAVTAELAAHPGNAQLHLKRGELHRNAEFFLFANDDFDRVEKIDPSITLVHLARARNYLGWRKPAPGLESIERYLVTEPPDALAAEAHEVHGKLLAALHRSLEAAAAFTLAIERSSSPSPDLFMERFGAYQSAGSAHLDAALRSLDQGIARLGPIVSLMQPALEMELLLHRFDAALARVNQIAATMPRPETWVARRGEILMQAGRATEAQAAFQQSLVKIELLPARHRATPATQQLEKEVRSKLNALEESTIAASN
ncbi:MAG: hypothetical protein EXQ56_01295 [Acidobacteria bacterium]|nr:hypothetical protein [Acidobacteriota bacterium]